ncbi:MarR family winged helix-turn-helix transcriptional regulator [Rhodococcus sp. IEGM 1307]|jgi:DNA-binding MarR family transcriptional regulator|uniref:MarR family winged helix-turn-helix transcriptional regulator n=1 Tax=Rhodococcus sp. IEGM 1307 TaxID=3047091 RepID=UPI0024B73246|nr:MarR family winged helix-turn-helix transcriptional regulator [Rhodococcus sp. IEGM 1307]MDI9973785.1 MarR family winged helix-turn-helix transcriptional regulator [Rhodococcus sp. IEGM 1307]
MHGSRTANLLGAAALAVSDLVLTRVTRVSQVSPSGAAALVVLSATPDLSVTELGRRVGLTQSAAARMVESLEGKNLAQRKRGAGRERAVALTSEGQRAARAALGARGDGLASLLAALDDEEREALAGVLDKLLARIYQDVRDSELLCRLCDRRACTTDAVCPVGNAERATEK